MEWRAHIEDCLKQARACINEIKDGDKVVTGGSGYGSLTGDTEIKADIEVGRFVRRYFSKFHQIGLISVEGQPDFRSGSWDFWCCVDPLDGSLNYKLKGNSAGLPYSLCVTILQKNKNALFSDIVAAGVIDLRCGDVWSSEKASAGFTTFMNGVPVTPFLEKKIDLGRMIVIGELYYPENRALFTKAFSGEKGWLRSIGSASYEMALVSSGQAVAFLCDRQKQHELGAGYALVKGAGGVAVNLKGELLDKTPYTFNAQTPALLAANVDIAKDVLRRLQ